MRTTDELEKEFANVPIQLAGSNPGHGVLSLAGEQTGLTLNTKGQLDERSDHTGWFNLVINQHDGRSILLLNAFVTSSTMSLSDPRAYQYRVFPNFVVLDAAPLGPQGLVREITFTLDGLADVFNYETAEWQSLWGASDDVKRSLKALRTVDRTYPRRYENFAPREAYILHALPRVLRERVGNRVYEIFVGSRQQTGRNRVLIEPMVLATIKFDTKVPLTDAIDEVWTWRRFFHQLAMRPLALTAIECRPSSRSRAPASDVYLSNLDNPPKLDTGYPRFSARNVPFNTWRDRKKLATFMRAWLERDEQRRQFRSRLDHVLDKMQSVTSTSLVAELCSAIETLEELRKPSELAAADLSKMIDAAAAVGATTLPPVPRERVKGLLGLLLHQSLPQSLKALAAELGDVVPMPLSRDVIRHARDFRTFDAHGGSWEELRVPLVMPTLHVLAAMCVLWDLKTSGLPPEHMGQLLANTHAKLSCGDLGSG